MSQIISTDVPDDLKDRIEEEQEEGESRSATVRRLIRRGLDAESIGVPVVLMILGAFMMGAALTPNMNPAYIMLIGVTLLISGVAWQRWGDD